MIYFAQRASDNAIKIGLSVDVSLRVYGLQSELKTRMVILGTMPGDAEDEAELHVRFRSLRIGGEWHLPGEELTAFIKAEAIPWDGSPPRRYSDRYRVLGIRVSPEFADWLSRKECKKPGLMNWALRHVLHRYARRHGYTGPIFPESRNHETKTRHACRPAPNVLAKLKRDRA